MRKKTIIGTLIVLVAIFIMACSAEPTAEDPNVSLLVAQAQLTSTSQALEIQIIGWTATAQSWTPTPSLTPIPTSTPTITPTPTINVTGTMMVERMNAEIADMEREAERADLTNKFWAVITPLIIVVLILIIVIGGAFIAITISRTKDLKVIDRGENDAPLLISLSKRRVIDMDSNPNFSGSFDESLLRQVFAHWLKNNFGVDPVAPVVTEDRQDIVKARDQISNMRSRATGGTLAMQKLLESQGLSLPSPETPKPPTDNLFALPSWDLVHGWNRDKDMLPLGNSDKGLEYWDLRIQAHLAVFGMTRSGKDRRLLRPLVAFMLASGQRVIMIGKETDFLPFIGHPNAVFVPVYDVTERDEAMKYASALEACVAEKNNRIRHMASRGLSLWDAERTYIVLDELGNALLEMPNDLSEFAMKKARSTVNEAGKAGISLVFSAQRPKGFIDLTTQCGRVAFQVENETERGYALGIKSAERLPDIPTGYFYKKFRALQITGGFEPSDDEIRKYLGMYSVRALPKIDWVDAVRHRLVETDQGTEKILVAENPVSQDEARIIELHRQGKKPSVIIREIWGITGGGRYSEKSDLVKSVLEKIDTSSSSGHEVPQNGLLGAA